ncbi:MAG TPA: hydantoinase B/oxoprolinase family protein [Solirubrobacteraceae bacterium]|nr:hydantoinase B/oxoprolinase family protein [Solirubrobacteraceae bacterium]
MADDPITVAVIASALRATAWEMSESLRRSSHSPIIREMLDYSCAVFTPQGEIVAQDELIPAFLGAMAATMPYVIDAAGGRPRAGDVWMTNDPYRGGTHTPDIQIFVPVLRDGELLAWCGNIAHHSDVGGPNPGTEGYANRSMFEEGLTIPPIRLVEDGITSQAVLALIESNIRDPGSTAGDLRAQLAAAKLGQRRIRELAERHGARTVGHAMAEILDQSERRVRAAIRRRPDGTAGAEGWLDDDGLGGDPQRIAVTVTVAGDRIKVDLTGTAPQMAGGLNMSATAARAAVYFVVKAIFDPDAPQNGAAIRAVDIILPEGSLANPHYPAAVSLRHLAVQRLTDTLLRAVADLYPDLATAGSFVGFSSLAAAVPHPRFGNEVIIQDDLGGGMGAHSMGDGLDAVDVYLGNVQMLPAEICEQQYSVRIVATELVPDSGGAGAFRGGLGMRRIYEFLDEGDGVFYTEQTRDQFAPHGADGGLPGTAACLLVERADGTREIIHKERLRLRAGDRLITTTGGGGGCGDPRRRDRAAVRRDLREEKISERAAREVYGLEAQAIPAALAMR